MHRPGLLIAWLCCLPVPCLAMGLILSLDGNCLSDDDWLIDQHSLDADGDGFADVVYVHPCTPEGTLYAVKLDGTAVWSYTPDRADICPTCGDHWDWYFTGFGDVDPSPGPECVLHWYDSDLYATGVWAVNLASGLIVGNFIGPSCEALTDFDGNGTEEVILEYDENYPEFRFEIWGHPLSGAVGDTGSGAAPFAARVRPNPAAQATTFAFAVPAAAARPASLRIVDPAGRCVRDLGGRTFAPGEHEIAWDGRDDDGHPVSPGVYYATLRIGEGEVTRQVVRIR